MRRDERSNLQPQGTTVTAVLAALSSPAAVLPQALECSLCHIFFNVLGILAWYPLPALRATPVAVARVGLVQ